MILVRDQNEEAHLLPYREGLPRSVTYFKVRLL
jgi:hypothetical protein